MRLLTFDAGAGPRVGLANDSGVVDLTARLGSGSLRKLYFPGKTQTAVGAAAD